MRGNRGASRRHVRRGAKAPRTEQVLEAEPDYAQQAQEQCEELEAGAVLVENQ